MMILLLAALSVAQAEVTRHALLVSSNDGGAGLPQLRYADRDAMRFQQVLTELGGFSPQDITILNEPGRDELLSALREHAWLAEQYPEDLFIFYYSGHADARGLRIGEETLPYTELRQGIHELSSEVRLGVLDACRSGEITRIKGLTLSEPFTSDDTLSAEGEVWLTASSANEDAQESDRVQGGFFTHYLISGLRGAADKDDGVVSLREAYAYAYERTVARTGRTDGGTQHPTYDFRLQGKGDLGITDVRNASARLTLPEPLAGVFTVLSTPDNTPLVEIAKKADVNTVVALPPGDYLLRFANGEGTAESSLHLDEGSNFVVPTAFRPIQQEVAMLRGAQPPPPPNPLRFRDANGRWNFEEIGEKWEDWWDYHIDHFENPMGFSDPDAVAESFTAQGPPVWAGVCVAIGPDCLEGDFEAEGAAVLLFDDGAEAARGTLMGGQPVGQWVFFSPEGNIFAQGLYLRGKMHGNWTWRYENGQVRQSGLMVSGQRSRRWEEFYENGQLKSRTRYELGTPMGKFQDWYPDGNRRSIGTMQGEFRVKTWTFYHPNGDIKARGSYDVNGRTGRWMTWSSRGQPSSKGRYWNDTKHGDWTFWWDNGMRSSRGSYNHGAKVGSWETWHPNGAKKSRGSYKSNLPDGRWSEWYDSGQPKNRGRYDNGEPVGRWTRWSPSGVKRTERHTR